MIRSKHFIPSLLLSLSFVSEVTSQGSEEIIRLRPLLLTPHPLGLGGGERLVPATPPQSSSDFSSLPGSPGCRADSVLNEALSPSVVWPSWQLQLPGAWLWGKAVKNFPHPWPPPPTHTPGDALAHSQPNPTHFGLM